MAKEVYYFSHDSNALTDTKILNMRADYGLEGYGLYWAIVEMLRNEENYKLNLDKKTFKAIKILTSTAINVEKFINDCINDYELFKTENNEFFSESLLKRMKEYDNRKTISRENGKKGGAPKGNQNAKKTKKDNDKTTQNNLEVDFKQPKTSQNDLKQPKERKGNERKKNERKGNENKRKEIIDIYNVVCDKLPQAQKLTDKRRRSIDNFLKDFTIEQFENICHIANSNSFLTGNNDRHWKADFDFIMRTDKAIAILEGRYNTFPKSGGFDDFKDLMEEARKKDELSRNSPSDNSFSWQL